MQTELSSEGTRTYGFQKYFRMSIHIVACRLPGGVTRFRMEATDLVSHLGRLPALIKRDRHEEMGRKAVGSLGSY